MTNQDDKLSLAYRLLCVYVVSLIIAGMYLMIIDENSRIGSLVLLLSAAGTVCIIAYGHVFRLLYAAAVVIGMTAMMLFSVVVDLPHSVVKAFEKLRTSTVRS